MLCWREIWSLGACKLQAHGMYSIAISGDSHHGMVWHGRFRIPICKVQTGQHGVLISISYRIGFQMHSYVPACSLYPSLAATLSVLASSLQFVV